MRREPAVNDIKRKMEDAAAYIRSKTGIIPEVGIVLGTGLGGLAERIESPVVIPYTDIPGFVRSTVESHSGELILGILAGKPVVAMRGRFHYYEGYTMEEITFPVRVMRELGAKVLVISNAAGGINLSFDKGDLVLISDHINYLGDNPLRGVSDPRLGPRFPDMSEPYSNRLRALAKQTAADHDIPIREGVYLAISGPSLETAAEYRFLRLIGADLVGMSTVPEDIVAVQMGMEVLGLTIVSDLGDPDNLRPVGIDEIIGVCTAAEPKLTALVELVIAGL